MLRTAASRLLRVAAQKLQSPRLATLATQVRLDAFVRVKKAIDDMIAQLLKEKEDEIKHKDFCVDGFNENEKMTQQQEHEKTDLETLIEDLTMKIDDLTNKGNRHTQSRDWRDAGPVKTGW
jgi:predicted neutral ceramidase superfamily lipid hydrolase